MAALSLDIARKRFAAVGQAPAVTALADFRLEAAAGEFLCLFGPSGCGKSTLLNIVAGLDRDYDGRVALPADPDGRSPVVGYVFQQPRLLPWRTVEENLRLVLRPSQSTAIVDELLAATGLAEFRHAYPERLSVGQARRVALARAFAVEPTLLLMDEPFVSLDEPTADRLRRLLLDIWRRRPITVLFVTHDTAEAVYLADRVAVFTPSPGRVAALLPIDLPRDRRADPARLEPYRRRLLAAGG